MSKHPCRDAFDAAQAFREKVPLPAGRYKLEQALWELGRKRADVELVIRIVRKQDPKAAKAALAGCAPEERGTYLKRIPREVRHEARRRLKHFPLSWDLPRIVETPGALDHMQETEEFYREQFWKELGIERR